LEEENIFENDIFLALSVAIGVEQRSVETNWVCRLGFSVSILIKVALSVYRVIIVGVKKP